MGHSLVAILMAYFMSSTSTALLDCPASWNSSLLSKIHNEEQLQPHNTQGYRTAKATDELFAKSSVIQIFVFQENEEDSMSIDALLESLARRFIQVELVSCHNRSMDKVLTHDERFKMENATFLYWGSHTGAALLLQQAQSLNLIGPIYNWILVGSIENLLLLSGRYVRPGDRVVIVTSVARSFNQSIGVQICSDLFSNTRVYLERYGLTRFSTIGSWSFQSGWSLTTNVFPQFHGFYGKYFTVAALPVQGVQFRVVINGTIIYVGFFFDILNEMAKTLQFRYRIVEPPDKNYGSSQPNGSWNGIIGMLQRKEIDFAVGPFTISAERQTVVDFMTSVVREQLGMLMRKPETDQLQSAILIVKPFQAMVWVTWLASIVFCGSVIWIFARFDEHNLGSMFEWKLNDAKLMKLSFWYSLGMSIAQGGDPPSRNSAVRVMMGLMWLTYIVVIATYTSNLIAFLTVTKSSLPINSLEDLVKQNSYKVGTIGNSAHQSIFQTADSGIYKQVWSKMASDSTNLVANESHGVMKAQQDNYIFITEGTLVDLVTINNCNFTSPKERFFPRDLGFPIQKKSPYTRIFNKIVMTMHESGLITKWKGERLKGPTSVSCEEQGTTTETQRLALTTLQGPFFILGIGIILGLISLFVELIVHNKSKMKIHPSTDNHVHGKNVKMASHY